MLFKTFIQFISIFLYATAVRADEDSAYEVELDSFDISTEFDDEVVFWDTLRLKKQGRNMFVVAGNFELKLNLGNEQKIILQVFKYDKQKQAKGPMIFNVEKEVCKFIAEDQDIYPGLKEKSNLPDKDTCPVPKNEYSIDNYEMRADFLPDETPAGEYLIVFLLQDGPKNNVAGFEAAITIKK